MRYTGRVKNGVVVFEGTAALPDGSRVEVLPVAEDASASSALPAFGLWRDRPEMADPAKASLMLRKETESRDSHG